MTTQYAERSTEFPAVIKFLKSGDMIEGLYRGTQQVPKPKRAGETMTSHEFTLKTWKGAIFQRQKLAVEAAAGDVVAISAQRLDRALRSEDIGKLVRLTYNGQAAGVGGNNGAHLFKVEVAA